ncbi:MAG: glycosyltransferase family 4 protein [Clostridia bacterium]|nr:glycosyltransferase family 4 protein [Clostridia bacterium]
MKILYVTTIGLTMGFFKDLIKELIGQGHTVEIACNESDRPVDPFYHELGCPVHQIDCSRSPLSKATVKAIKQLKGLVETNRYDVVHCHTPVAATCTRLACRKLRKTQGVKVFYTAHGFHFCKGAPLKNWLIYYPVEKLCAHYTDKLITINHEDYSLAQRKMKAREVLYVPGVGVDLKRFQNVFVDKAAKRRELGIPEDATVLLSVSEVNENKNHQIIIRAMARLQRENMHYMIAGSGPLADALLQLAQSLGMADRVHMLGYRNDIPELCYAADIFCFPSYREGLGLAAIEAMACGLPIVTSNVHGINDYSQNNVTGYKCAPKDTDGFAEAIRKLADDPTLRKQIGVRNVKLSESYDVSRIVPLMMEIYHPISSSQGEESSSVFCEKIQEGTIRQ